MKIGQNCKLNRIANWTKLKNGQKLKNWIEIENRTKIKSWTEL